VQLHASGARAIAYTRNGLDWTRRFAGIAKAFSIPRQAIVDGEAVVIEDGRTNFSELQAALAAGRQGRTQ
jgi:bifunctional non-homologous end joining protein LigD